MMILTIVYNEFWIFPMRNSLDSLFCILKFASLKFWETISWIVWDLSNFHPIKLLSCLEKEFRSRFNKRNEQKDADRLLFHSTFPLSENDCEVVWHWNYKWEHFILKFMIHTWTYLRCKFKYMIVILVKIGKHKKSLQNVREFRAKCCQGWIYLIVSKVTLKVIWHCDSIITWKLL